MPKRLVRIGELRRPDAIASDLEEALYEEWMGGGEGEGRPDIVLERDEGRRVVHIYVVWDRWDMMGQLQRSEIIMNVVSRAEPTLIPEVTLAMGLTHDEVPKTGLAI